MTYKYKLAALATVGALTIAGSAQALVTVTSVNGAPDPGAFAGQTMVIDFEGGVPGFPVGVTAFGNGQINFGGSSSPGDYEAPAGDTTDYLSVPDTGTSGSADIMLGAWLPGQVASFSFYWGSIDKYNTIELLDKAGVVYFSQSGGTIPPSDGDTSDPFTNRRVNFTLTGSDRNLGGVRLTSTNKAFEVDDFAFQSAVPEPATWAMMIIG
ncbi:hypothetical protein, partial [Phenylobacterium sp.]|uniref:Npun_F0296 family exosortase-dependent surface protein n=1 Tax=Phenylobacterium sp. TaxID=1871053 RepID=UPI00286C8ED5